MKKWVWFFLLAILIFAVFLRTIPLAKFAVWGSDTGEYYYLTENLNNENVPVEEYNGWGSGYPDFPGMFYLTSGVVQLTGLNPLYTLLILTPVLSALSVILIFLLTRRLGGSYSAGLIAAAVVAVAMPHVFSTSHAMPGTLGDLLGLTCLLLLLTSYKSKFCIPLLILSSIALIMTHHLSTFIFLAVVVSIIFFREIMKFPDTPLSRAKFDLAFVFFLLTATLIYWLLYASFFRERVIEDNFGASNIPFIAALSYIGFAAFAAVIYFFRKRSKFKYKLKDSNPKRRLVYFAVTLALAFLPVVLGIFGLIPSLDISPDPILLIYLLPLIILFPIGILGSNETLHGPEGIFLIAWMTGMGLAVVGSVIAGGQVIILYRFTQYMMEPWAIFMGFGAVWLLSLITKGYFVKSDSSVQSRPHRALPVAAIITILIISAGALAYPPKSAMSGFQEGITEEEMIGVIWSDSNIESGAAVASDHRLSSMLFGFAGLNASWDYVALVFSEDSFADARDELNCSGLPSGRKRIDYVMLSDELKSGVALVQWEQAEPISDASLSKFSKNPFYTIYDSGEVQIYFIDWNYDPGGNECSRE